MRATSQEAIRSGLLLFGINVRVCINTQAVTQGHMVEAAFGVVIMNRKTKVVGIAWFQRHVTFTTGQLAGEHHSPGAVLQLAFGANQGLTAFHDTLVGNIAVIHLVFTATPLVQVIEHTLCKGAVLDILGFALVAIRHGADVTVAAPPAPTLFCQFNLAAFFQHVGQLNRVGFVHLRRAGCFRLLPGKAQIQVFTIVSSLYLGVDKSSLAGNRGWLNLAAAGYQLAHVAYFFRVTPHACLATFEYTGTTMGRTTHDPLHWRYARIQQVHIGCLNLAPVCRSGSHCCSRGKSKYNTGNTSHHHFFHHCLLSSGLENHVSPNLRLSCLPADGGRCLCGNQCKSCCLRSPFRAERWPAFSVCRYPCCQNCGSCGIHENRSFSSVSIRCAQGSGVSPQIFPEYRCYQPSCPKVRGMPGSCEPSCNPTLWARDSPGRLPVHPYGWSSGRFPDIRDIRYRASRGTRCKTVRCWSLPGLC